MSEVTLVAKIHRQYKGFFFFNLEHLFFFNNGSGFLPMCEGIGMFPDKGLCHVQERVTQLELTLAHFVENYRFYIRRHCLNKSVTAVSNIDVYFLLLETKIKG